MSSTDQNQVNVPTTTNSGTETNTENKSPVVTGYIVYKEGEDLAGVFESLKKFRTNNGLKFSHHAGYIFFTIRSDHLAEFAKERKFKISKFVTKSEYSCTKEVADKIYEQRDAFIRIIWDEENGKVLFSSKVPPRIHSTFVRRVFKGSEQEFEKDSYKVVMKNKGIKKFTRNESDETDEPTDKPTDKPKKYIRKTKFQKGDKIEESEQTKKTVPEGFTRVGKTRKDYKSTGDKTYSKPRVNRSTKQIGKSEGKYEVKTRSEQTESTNSYKSVLKKGLESHVEQPVEKPTEPKIRGKKVQPK